MAKKVAPPKTTGGGGFTFEDQVIGWLLAHMLADEPLFGNLGRIERLDFQTRVDGWFLDDLLVTLARDGNVSCKWSVSIKSNVQFSGVSAPEDFVATAWEQFLHKDTVQFDVTADLLGLVTSSLPKQVRVALDNLVNKAIAGDSKLLPARLATPRWANDAERSFFKSFKCPSDLAATYHVTEEDVGRFIAHLRFPEFDFDALDSDSAKVTNRLCRSSLRSGEVAEATNLCEALNKIAKGRKPQSGFITRLQLIDELRGRFKLNDYPNHREDLTRLAEYSRVEADQIAWDIGGRVRIDRASALVDLDEAIGKARGVVLVGSSGSGKSAIGRLWLEQREVRGARTLWFDGQQFEQSGFAEFEANLQLDNRLSDILSSVGDNDFALVLDGLDRVYGARAFDLVGALIRLLDLDRVKCPWRVVIICQTHEWPRVKDSLVRAGVAAKKWQVQEPPVLELSALGTLQKEFPAVAKLLRQSKLGPVLSNLKILDMVARRTDAGEDVETTKWVGESSVAEWFWESEVARGEAGAVRARFALKLGEMQADTLRRTIPADSFEISELQPLGKLIEDRVCRRTTDEHVAFEHDLFGDWARLRSLISHSSDIASYLDARRGLDSPLWHRALRLFGLYLLEHLSDVSQWRSFLAVFDKGDSGVAHDLLLESSIFAADPARQLGLIASDLFVDSGRLLRRLLTRFMAYATVPHPAISMMASSEGIDPTAVESRFRYPIWRYWPPILSFLHSHRDDVVANAPVEVAELVELWLRHMPVDKKLLRREAGELALALGARARRGRESFHGDDYKSRDLYYRVALAAAPELPDEVASFAILASETETDEIATESTAPELTERQYFDALSDRDELAAGPWPGGPCRRVDEKFRHVILDQGALTPLINARPAVARKVALATLIKPRLRFELSYGAFGRDDLDLDSGNRWHPPLYTLGPFLTFLQTDFNEGLELIARLVDFATDRYTAKVGADDEERAASEETGSPIVRDLHRLVAALRLSSNALTINIGGVERVFSGDGHVFGWAAGHGTSPATLVAALMALEQYFYLALDEKLPIDEEIEAVLDRAKSVAFFKVLVEVGKRELALFEGPLLPLLAVPEIYYWDAWITRQGRDHLGIGAPLKGAAFVHQVVAFHTLEHRKIDLQLLARQFLFYRPGMQPFFEAARKTWKERLGGTSNDPLRAFVEELAILLDLAAYQPQEIQGQTITFVNVIAQERANLQADERRAAEDGLLVTSLPIRCRTMLDKKTQLEPDQLARFWADLQRIHAMATEKLGGDAHRQWPADFAHALAGGIAVLIRSHSSWLAQDASRLQWCLDWLTQTISVRPAAMEYDVPESAANWTWDCFLAEALAEIWSKSPDDRHIRSLIPHLLFAPHFVAIEILFRRCAANRTVLGADFNRLRHLAFEAAYTLGRLDFVRFVQRVPRPTFHSTTLLGRLLNRLPIWRAYRERKSYPPRLSPRQVQKFGRSVDQWAQERFSAFVNGSTPSEVGPWDEIGQSQYFEAVDRIRAEWNTDNKFNFQYIRSVHDWMIDPPHKIDLEDRSESLEFWRNALAFILASVAKATERSDSSYPSETERWVLDGTAAAVLNMTPDENPDAIWEKILSLPESAYFWPENFLQSFYRAALTCDQPPAEFEKMVRRILAVALPSDSAAGTRWRRHDDVWDALVGLDTYTQSYWSERHASLVANLSDVFEGWLKASPFYARRVAVFAKWAERPAASLIRLRAIVWIEKELVRRGSQSFDWDRAADEIASLLNVLWHQDEANLRNDSQAFPAFRSVLRMLANQQNSFALGLVGRIGGLGV